MAGWQLVKCTSIAFLEGGWEIVYIYNKNMYLRRIGSFCRTGGRQIPSYLSKAADIIC